MTTYYVIYRGGLQGCERYDTIEEADKAARSRTALTGKFWYVRTIEVKAP